MRILILGAAGFLGSRLVGELAQHCPEADILASDLRGDRGAWPGPGMERVDFIGGDILDPDLPGKLFSRRIDAVFHLAATLTVEAENSFERGMDSNIHALIKILEACRAQGNAPKLVFASSISTFGGDLPPVVDDHVRQTPQTSYGSHKVIGEQLINDYSRRGYLDGRSLRLPIVLTHPGPPSASVSDRIASLIREPLNGGTAHCPVNPDTPIAVASVDRVLAAMLRLLAIPADALTHTRAMNMPALTVTPRRIVEAVSSRMPVAASVSWKEDRLVQAAVESWPWRFTSSRALQHGIEADRSAEEIVDAYLAERDRRRLRQADSAGGTGGSRAGETGQRQSSIR